jgi:hypothetical protein
MRKPYHPILIKTIPLPLGYEPANSGTDFSRGREASGNGLNDTSCTLVFRVIPKNSTFQTKVINLDVKTGRGYFQ